MRTIDKQGLLHYYNINDEEDFRKCFTDKQSDALASGIAELIAAKQEANSITILNNLSGYALTSIEIAESIMKYIVNFSVVERILFYFFFGHDINNSNSLFKMSGLACLSYIYSNKQQYFVDAEKANNWINKKVEDYVKDNVRLDILEVACCEAYYLESTIDDNNVNFNIACYERANHMNGKVKQIVNGNMFLKSAMN